MFAGNARENRSSTASSLPRRSSTEGDPFSAVDPACTRPPSLDAPRASCSSLRDGKFTHSENSVDERESFGNFVVGTLEEDFPENVYVYLYIHTLEKPDLARVDYDFQLLGTLARFSSSFPISGDPTRAFGTRSGLKVKCRIVAGQTVALVNGRLRGEKVEGGSPSCIHLV